MHLVISCIYCQLGDHMLPNPPYKFEPETSVDRNFEFRREIMPWKLEEIAFGEDFSWNHH